MSKNRIVLAVFYISFKLLKRCLYFKQIKVAYGILNYGLMRRAAKKNVVVIYGVMYTEHCEYTLRTETIECFDNESLD